MTDVMRPRTSDARQERKFPNGGKCKFEELRKNEGGIKEDFVLKTSQVRLFIKLISLHLKLLTSTNFYFILRGRSGMKQNFFRAI